MAGRLVTSTVTILAIAVSAGFAQNGPAPQESTRAAGEKDASADRASPPAVTARTRAEEIERLRREKARNLTPDLPPKGEQIFTEIQKNILQKVFGGVHGLRPSLGGLYPRSGFAAGPEYFRPDLADGRVQFRAAAKLSTRLYEKADVQLSFPRLANDHAFLDLIAVYRNYPQVDYYGPGPNSSKNGRSNYRLEDHSADFTAGLRPFRYLKFGATGGYLGVNVGPGTDERFVSTEQIYTEAQAPGVQYQSNFLRGGPFVQFDYRDRPGDPHKGGNYIASFLVYDDRGLDVYNFRRFSADVQQYIPFFNEKRTIALRGRTELSYRNSGVPIPFYLQPTLGGSDDLRGYRVFRFYDDNSFVMNGEYRWEVMSGLDMAVFMDAGKVFHSKSQLNFADMRTDAGFGLRFSSKQSVFMRWDFGFSPEGFQVWIKFGNLF
jgi:hypothetical protein